MSRKYDSAQSKVALLQVIAKSNQETIALAECSLETNNEFFCNWFRKYLSNDEFVGQRKFTHIKNVTHVVNACRKSSLLSVFSDSQESIANQRLTFVAWICVRIARQSLDISWLATGPAGHL